MIYVLEIYKKKIPFRKTYLSYFFFFSTICFIYSITILDSLQKYSKGTIFLF